MKYRLNSTAIEVTKEGKYTQNLTVRTTNCNEPIVSIYENVIFVYTDTERIMINRRNGEEERTPLV